MNRIKIRSRLGAGEVLTTVLALPLFAVLLSYLAYFGRALYARAAVEEAVAAGARFAVTSLSGEQGCRQAHEAMTTVLQGYSLDATDARLLVQPIANWGRGARVQVSVAYHLHQPPTLFFSTTPLSKIREALIMDREVIAANDR